MNRLQSTFALTFLVGATLAALGGCEPDKDLPPDTTSSSSSGSGGMSSCGDGKLDMGEACDDGNNSGDDGCTACVVDECFSCTGETGATSTCTPKAANEPCQTTKFCSATGACVECTEDAQCAGGGYCFMNVCAKCDDTVKNGDETDVDCGGGHCGDCANGKTCAALDDCTSMFCTDGVCCDTLCDGACNACSIPGFVGECSFIDKYGEDPSYGTGMTCLKADGKACSAGGTCAKAIGQTCANNAECASTRCADPEMDMTKNCVGLTGDPCTLPGDCNSNMCMNNVCM